jgi:hypothetical protein
MINPLIEVDSRNVISITIFVSPPKKILMIILLLFGTFSFIFPFSLVFIDNLELGLGYIITLFLFLGSATFFFRAFLWNKFGKEVYRLGQNRFSYYYHYGLLKDNTRESSFKQMEIGFCKLKDQNKSHLISDETYGDSTLCYLSIMTDDNVITSKIPITYKYVKIIDESVNRGKKSGVK